MSTLEKQALLGAALDQRLTAVAPYLYPDGIPQEIYDRGTAILLEFLAEHVARHGSNEDVWLLTVAVSGGMPTPAALKSCERRLRLAPPERAWVALLEAVVESTAGRGLGLQKELKLVVGGVVVDVDFCARHAHNTGVQRVVRQTMARWSRTRELTFAAWMTGDVGMRTLTDVERARVVSWGTPPDESAEENPADAEDGTMLVVPYRSTVILPEVAQLGLCEPLAALAEFSGNQVGMVGYDAIPIVSADTVPEGETERFTRYLAIVKHANRVVGISEAASEEFAGFADAARAQGLAGPETATVALPVDIPDVTLRPHVETSKIPLVLVVGSQEPRKNHYALLFAAERLWREGISFRLRFIGGGSAWYTRGFDRAIRNAKKKGYPVEVLRGVSDDVLIASYREARFTAFPSLHEGYGLPVAESLALGVPVLTTNYGSTAEIARDGGCVLVNPRDDDAIVAAMRDLVTDDALCDRLRQEIAERPTRTWDDYAEELWAGLVEPLTGRNK